MGQRTFHIITVANNLKDYAGMRAAFEAAGFTEAVARYTLHDNSLQNTKDPYAVLRELAQSGQGSEQYTILCHQDVRPDLGHTATTLVNRLEDLTRSHPKWAIAGNAGTTTTGRWTLHLNDPSGQHRAKRLPVEARSLDENLLVIRSDAGLLVSDGLSGFHLYGTDACLSAAYRGREAYIIDFLLTHHSSGNALSDAFNEAKRNLINAWRPKTLVGLIGTLCTNLQFSRSTFIEGIISNRFVGRVIRRCGLGLFFSQK